jgi:hypothetical protein
MNEQIVAAIIRLNEPKSPAFSGCAESVCYFRYLHSAGPAPDGDRERAALADRWEYAAWLWWPAGRRHQVQRVGAPLLRTVN